MNEFMTGTELATFSGIVAAVVAIVQFTKPILKRFFKDSVVRPYTFIIALILTSVFVDCGSGIEGIILNILNAILISLTAMGTYESIADPLAEKEKELI